MRRKECRVRMLARIVKTGRLASPGGLVRAWVALHLQERRRVRAAASGLKAPQLLGFGFDIEASGPMTFDLWLDWSFDHGTLPAATIEIWLNLNLGEYALMDTVPSTDTHWVHTFDFLGEDQYDVMVRYRDGGTVGPWSNVLETVVQQ